MSTKDISMTHTREVRPTELAAYLSGYSGSAHNHPLIFAWGMPDEEIAVYARGHCRSFPADQLAGAVEFYREALIACGYQVGAVAERTLHGEQPRSGSEGA